VGLSRRQISARLNDEGLTFNGGPFSHPDITNILDNPAYAGDTHFGKVQTGRLYTFNAKGLLNEVKAEPDDKRRDVSECLVKRDTHAALVDRKTWELAQKKLAGERLAAEEGRKCFAPRNPAYYLKQLFVCGHCGKGLTGRTETNPTTGEKTVIYVCPTYVAGRCNGHKVRCGYQRITHEDAERLLLDKIAELGLEHDATGSDQARANLQTRLARLGHDDEESIEQWGRWYDEGMDAFADYLNETYGESLDCPAFRRLKYLASEFYCHEEHFRSFARLPVANLAELKKAVGEAEEAALEKAGRKLAGLEEEYAAYTRAWVKAGREMQQAVLKKDMERLEAEILDWKPRTVPLSERFKALYAAEAEREAERQKLLDEWPALESREKGEALRRLFNTVTLYWERRFHPASTKPTRPRKTDRPGRYSYTLQTDRIKWAFATSDLDNSW
jgi:Recombinase/Recombinase zinc beta ribbon domain